MKRKLRLALPVISVIVVAAAAGAVSVLLDATGGPMPTLEVRVTDLGEDEAPTIGAFDVDAAFDPAVLALDAVEFGAFLGGPDSVQDVLTGTGLVDVAEVSLRSADALDALQPAAFTLATLRFRGLDATETLLSLPSVLLGDASGAAIPVASPMPVAVTAALPEPSALGLLGLGPILLALCRAVPRARV